jgi:hypothetical protein
MHRLAEDCCERVLRGEKLYIHCWGGHGRTGEGQVKGGRSKEALTGFFLGYIRQCS